MLDLAQEKAGTGKNVEAIALLDEIAARCSTSKEPAILAILAHALFCKGDTLHEAGKYQEAIGVYDEVIGRFGKSGDLNQRQWAVWSLVHKGQALADLSQSTEALATFDEAARAAGTQPSLGMALSMALYLKGFELLRTGDGEHALATLDQVVRRLSTDGSAPDALIVLALDGQAMAFEQVGKIDEALATYDRATARYADSKDPAVQAAIASTLVDKGIALTAADDFTGALRVYEAVIAKFGSLKNPDMQGTMATAYLNRGAVLWSLSRYPDARAAFEDVIRRFNEAPEPAVKNVVVKAQAALARMAAFGVEGANAQSARVAPVPTSEFAMSLPPSSLASSYMTAKEMLGWMDAASGITIITPEGTINEENAPKWRKVFAAREAIYREAIIKRGFANFAGDYRMSSQSASCAKAQSSFAAVLTDKRFNSERLTISQSGFELKLKLGNFSSFEIDGYAVESTFAFTDPMNGAYTHIGELTGKQLLVRPQSDVLRFWSEFEPRPKAEDIRNCLITLVREPLR